MKRGLLITRNALIWGGALVAAAWLLGMTALQVFGFVGIMIVVELLLQHVIPVRK